MLDATPNRPQDTTTLEPPKDNTPSSITSPPPAYAPPPSTNIPLTLPQLTAMRLRRLESQTAYLNNTNTTNIHRPLTTTILSGGPDFCNDADDDLEEGVDEDDEPQRALCLRINTSVSITQSNNIVCLADTPSAEHATAIANAVVKAIQENSSGNSGIPMIDGNGHPRPIKVEVDASMLIEGSGNVVGNAPIINEYFRQGGLRRSRAATQEGDGQEAAPPSKRRRVSAAE
ncbi:hypothetical protein CC79DRAFT_1316808 [Sarocladium strictum]